MNALPARRVPHRVGRRSLRHLVERRGPRLDPARWSALFSELGHLVRNAVDHGFESPEELLAFYRSKSAAERQKLDELLGQPGPDQASSTPERKLRRNSNR